MKGRLVRTVLCRLFRPRHFSGRYITAALASVLCSGVLSAQGVITTIAGTDSIFTVDNVPPLDVPLSGTFGFGLGTDTDGNLLIADGGNHALYRVGKNGLVSRVAGNGIPSFSGDGGPARAASLFGPQAVVTDAQGNLYVAESQNNDIRRITPQGTISTVAGNGMRTFAGDGGPAIAGSFAYPTTLAIDAAGNLYVGSIVDSRIRKITTSGLISTVAGNGKQAYSGDGGPAADAALNYPSGLAVDAAGNLYIADALNGRIRKVTPDGIISTIAGGGLGFTTGPVKATAAAIVPTALTFDASGNLYFADLLLRRVAKMITDGTIVTVAGNGRDGVSGDGGPADQATLTLPNSLTFDAQGNLYIADSAVGTVRVVKTDGTISKFAGNGLAQYGGDGGPAIFATMNVPGSVAVDPSSGNIYIADSLNNRVRKIDSKGVMTTFAGTGRAGSLGDGGPAQNADLFFPAGVAVAKDGTVYVSEQVSAFVRKIRPDGIIELVAGTGLSDFSGDNGPAVKATLIGPTALEVDAAGNLYIADSGDNRIRKIDAYGVITTVAGGGTVLGDGGPATSASLKLANYGGGLAIDAQGNLFIADTYNHRIRKVTPDGMISTVAGTGKADFSGDNGPAINAALWAPQGIAFDKQGNLLIADNGNDRVRKISGGIITTIAGTGHLDFKGDGGPAVDAALRWPNDVAVDPQGNILIADQFNNRIRAILAAPPTFDIDKNTLQFSARSGGPVTQPELVTVNGSVPGVQFTVTATTSGGGDWLQVNPSSGAAPRLLEISANPLQAPPGTYTGEITITAPTTSPRTRRISVKLEVAPGPPPVLDVDKQNLSFTFANGSSARSDVISILDTGGGVLDFTAAATTVAGGDWLKLSGTTGKATAASPAVLAVTADPSGFPAGSYRGEITVSTASGQSKTIAVTMTVSTFEKGLLLTQSGLSFTAVRNGGSVPPQTFGILNIGKGLINWTVSASSLSGGDWLSISQTSGQTESSVAVPLVEVQVNPAGLAPGSYYGLVRVDYGTERTDNPDAANSPQMLTVFLEVLPEGSDPGPLIRPGELVFTGVSGADYPASQEILLYNVSSSPKSFRSTISDGPDNFSVSAPPRDGTIQPGQPTHIVVQPRVDNPSADNIRPALTLRPGVYTRELAFQFSDGRVRTVPVRLIVAPSGTEVSTKSNGRRNATGCTPTQLIPSITSLGQSFAVSAGWPVALATEVRDDCGTPMDDGFVSVSFSNGDPPVLLQPLKDGRWQGSWAARNTSRSQVSLRVEAIQPQLNLRGTRDLSGDLRSAQDAPITDKGRIVSAASLQPFVPVAPGSRIAILGERLAENNASAATVPLPTNLAGTEVLIAGRSMPLLSVAQDQLIAVVPAGVNVNTSQQVLIRRGVTLSRPVAVDVAPAQPAVFRDGDRLVVLHAAGEGSQPAYVTTDAPAHPGENLVIFSAGLGLTNPQIPDGDAAPQDTPAPTTETVKVTIGGVDAPVSFAGLVPGMPAMYQIKLAVPDGITAGDQVPVVISVAGQISPQVAIAVR